MHQRVFEIARADDRITGGAVTGSRAVGREDRWSDIDTAFGVRPGASAEAILDDWTEELDREFDVVHRFDLARGATRYGVFLLANALELDVSLTETGEFGAHGPTFQLVFGEAHDQPSTPESPDELIGWGWIFALYTPAAIARGRPWQAEYTINGTRENGLALACPRFGLPADHRRGVDRLPPEVTAPWEAARVRSLEPNELPERSPQPRRRSSRRWRASTPRLPSGCEGCSRSRAHRAESTGSRRNDIRSRNLSLFR